MKSVKLRWIKRERQRLGIQMHANEIFLIARAIRPPVDFLILGMGNDSPFWFRLNQKGGLSSSRIRRNGSARSMARIRSWRRTL